jgi:hypothetical protein
VREDDVDDISAAASTWLTVAAELGWGIEGPAHADSVVDAIESIARGARPDDAELAETIAARDLRARPVDALFESAGLLIEACGVTGTQRAELLSAARGWLLIAVRRSPQ